MMVESKRNSESSSNLGPIDVRHLLQKLYSWRKESDKQFSNIIDSLTQGTNNDVEAMAEVGDLQSKLSEITQERNDLLYNVMKLSEDNSRLQAMINEGHPLTNEKQKHDKDSPQDVLRGPLRFADPNKIESFASAANCHGNDSKEQGESASAIYSKAKHEENPLNAKLNHSDELNHSDDLNHSDELNIEIKQEEWNKEGTDEGDQEKKQTVVAPPADGEKCPKCSFVCAPGDNLEIHMKNLHSYMCDQCDYQASQKGHLTQHKKGVHENVRDYKCSECNFATGRSFNLKKHKLKIHKMGKDTLKLKCKQCPHTTNTNKELRSHIEAVHENKRSHKCGICDWAFRERSRLRRHMKFVHSQDDNKWVAN